MTKEILQRTKDDFEWTYYGDLFYFSAFKHLKNDSFVNGIAIGDFDFYKQFLFEFRISRNISKDKKKDSWKTFQETAKEKIHINTVDELANGMFKEYHPRGGVSTSCCSKLMMLLEPSLIIPIDSLNRKALGYYKNNYEEFYSKVLEFEKEYQTEIKSLLEIVDERASKIEMIFNSDLEKLLDIRKNRLMDKFLVQIGRSMI